MRVALYFSIFMVGVMLAPSVPTCEAQAWKDLAKAVADKLTSLWDTDDLEFLGHECNYSVRPKIRRFQLYFQGRMWCPGWTPIRGEALTRSRSGVVGKTTANFAQKAFESGLITEEEARAWLEG
ncbi:hypothetical protein SK128_002989 [Halocaridina rubra]|uniref:Anti-lipopolysaccharide factor n=1 Tax=Halocaridina rubra TaxID=373956 RepID=A0AAN8XGS8_HALRR